MHYNFFKPKFKGVSSKSLLSWGFYGIRALESAELSRERLDGIRKLLSSFYRRNVRFRFLLHRTWFKYRRSLGSRMGSGKSPRAHEVYKIRKGKMFLEWQSTLPTDPSLLKKLTSKLPMKTMLCSRGL